MSASSAKRKGIVKFQPQETPYGVCPFVGNVRQLGGYQIEPSLSKDEVKALRKANKPIPQIYVVTHCEVTAKVEVLYFGTVRLSWDSKFPAQVEIEMSPHQADDNVRFTADELTAKWPTIVKALLAKKNGPQGYDKQDDHVGYGWAD